MAITTKVIPLDECDKSYEHTLHNNKKIRFCTDGESSLDVFGIPTDTRRTSNTEVGMFFLLYVVSLTIFNVNLSIAP